MDSICEIGNELPNLTMDRKVSDQDIVSFEDVSDCLSPYGFNHQLGTEIRHLDVVAVVALYYETVNKLPPNPSSLTYTCFGFSELPEAEHPNLVGLYQELILSLECKIEEFILALRCNLLFSMIERKYLLQSKNGRGKYRWACTRKDLFDSLQLHRSVIHYGVYPRSGFSQRSWPGKGIPVAYHPGDQVVTLKDMQSKIAELLPWEDCPSKSVLSKSEIAVTVLYYETLTGKLPSRCSVVYNSFGFSKVHPLDIQSLAGLYKELICDLKCGRKKFLKAYEAGALYELIDSRFSKLPAGKIKGNCYSEWFVLRKVLFKSLKPVSPSREYPRSAQTTCLPIPSEEEVQPMANIHAVVADYLTEEERRKLWFTNLNSNKLAVIHLFYEALQGRWSSHNLPRVFSCSVLPEAMGDLTAQKNAFPLYRTLIIGLGCQVEEFLRAYESGQVMELIVSKFSQLPADDRGFHYNTWFPKYKNLFKGVKSSQESDVASPRAVPGLFHGDFDWRMEHQEELEDDEHFLRGPSSETKTAVAHLYEDIVSEESVPLHPLTRRCFGFDKLAGESVPLHPSMLRCFGFDKLQPSLLNQLMLFKIYKHIIENLKCRRQTFLEVYESGKMVGLIEWAISKLPISQISADIMTWFYEHTAIFREIRPPTKEDGSSPPGSKLCGICNEVSTFRCGGCKEQWYCSKEHQTRDWKAHKKTCATEKWKNHE